MKSIFCLTFIMLFSVPLHAETYSWVDDSGTYNFTEDYSSVPKKYRKKVKYREDMQQDVKPSASPDADSKQKQIDKKDVKSVEVSGNSKELYGGKSWDAWRKEMDAQEAELKRIELRMEEMRKQLSDSKVPVSPAQYNVLKKEYEDNRADYDQKYKAYNDLIEMVRKAGINVEIKK